MALSDINDEGAKAGWKLILTVSWAFFGVVFLLSVIRLAIRIKYSKRIYWDDGWAFFALLTLLAHAIIIHFMLEPMYIAFRMQSIVASSKRSSIWTPIILLLKLQFTENVLFWTCLWAVKASFLAFFKRLTTNVRGYSIAWWVIAVITSLAFVGSIITYPLACSDFSSPLQCAKPRNTRLALVSLRFSTCVDIITDAMIIALPVTLIWRVRLPWKSRLALVAVFSLGALIILFAIIRLAFVNNKNRQPEVTWLTLWSCIEAGIACVVCNLAPFKIWFSGHAKSRNYSDNLYSGGRYGTDDKKTVESHEMSLTTSQPTRSATRREPRPPFESRDPYGAHESFSRITEPPARYVGMHLPRGVHKGLLRVSISADHRGSSETARAGILVTQELERKIVTADQVTVDSKEAYEHDQRPGLRTTWYEQPSDEALDLHKHRMKAFA